MADPLTVDVQPTPNINALKFIVNRRVTEGRSQTFRSIEEAGAHPLASRLFAIPGVVQVFLLNDFVTVTRNPAKAWDAISSSAEAAIQEYFSAG